MLVLNQNPGGILHVLGYRIYGDRPIEVPFEVYSFLKKNIRDGTYRKDYLQKYFAGPFDDIAFTYSEARYLPRKTLEMLCQGMQIKCLKKHTNKRLVEKIKTKLRNVKAY